LQQAYASWSSIKSAQDSIADALELLDQPLPSNLDQSTHNRLKFNSEINLHNVSFSYGLDLPNVIQSINLRIPKGGRVGFIGQTGSGKSTLLDIIMGLLEPTDGVMKIDGQPVTIENMRSWQTQIAHVPQFIFLADSSVLENIAFGVPADQIDHKRVFEAARDAQISEAIESWANKYNTVVGENGVRLSGGQRQRIGIARALYKRASVIILDEATSALDGETESAVMEVIGSLSKELTLIIVAHRITSLKGCTEIVSLKEGAINWSGSYLSLAEKSKLEFLDHPL
jgi:ATP-binding cassette subfamily B protein